MMALQIQVRRVVAAINAVSSNTPLVSTESVQPEVQFQADTIGPGCRSDCSAQQLCELLIVPC
jgi:hypothetical protein